MSIVEWAEDLEHDERQDIYTLEDGTPVEEYATFSLCATSSTLKITPEGKPIEANIAANQTVCKARLAPHRERRFAGLIVVPDDFDDPLCGRYAGRRL